MRPAFGWMVCFMVAQVPHRKTLPRPARFLQQAARFFRTSACIIQGAAALGLDERAALACLGETTSDVFLDDVAYWPVLSANSSD
jgi:hypothetical protein